MYFCILRYFNGKFVTAGKENTIIDSQVGVL